jgi:S1-C subfamily serine protease
VRRKYIGIGGQNIDLPRRLVRHFELTNDKGVLIVGIEEKGPAQQAGLREGDVIVEFGEKSVSTLDDLHRLLSDEQLETIPQLKIIRRSEKLHFRIAPEELKK